MYSLPGYGFLGVATRSIAITASASSLLCSVALHLMQGMIQNFVRSTLSLTFVIAAARVVFNIKARMAREASWQLELKGDLTKQRRVEAVDKLLSVMTLLVSAVFGLQAVGLDGKLINTFACSQFVSSRSCLSALNNPAGPMLYVYMCTCHMTVLLQHASLWHVLYCSFDMA